jgi:UDPglucose 6-dehydrogenase
MKRNKAKSAELIENDLALHEPTFFNSRVVNDLAQFKAGTDVIVTSRIADEIKDAVRKVYSSDFFGQDQYGNRQQKNYCD